MDLDKLMNCAGHQIQITDFDIKGTIESANYTQHVNDYDIVDLKIVLNDYERLPFEQKMRLNPHHNLDHWMYNYQKSPTTFKPYGKSILDDIQKIIKHRNTFIGKYDIKFNDKKETVTILEFNPTNPHKYTDNITTVKCNDNEYDKRYGFLLAWFQRTSGMSKTQANKYLYELDK